MGEIFWFTVAQAFAVQTPQKHLALCHHRGQQKRNSSCRVLLLLRLGNIMTDPRNLAIISKWAMLLHWKTHAPKWKICSGHDPQANQIDDSENFSSSQMLNDPFMDLLILTLPLNLRNQTIGVFATVHFMTVDTQLASWWCGRLPPAVLGTKRALEVLDEDVPRTPAMPAIDWRCELVWDINMLFV